MKLQAKTSLFSTKVSVKKISLVTLNNIPSIVQALNLFYKGKMVFSIKNADIDIIWESKLMEG
jgi:hypothetical protein